RIWSSSLEIRLSMTCVHGRWNCSLEHCPVHGGLSSWGPWSPCSLSCGGLGLKTRSRGCTQPAPAHGGRDCQGPRRETTYCQCARRNFDGGWSRWSPWSRCDKRCGGGRSIRTRSCSSPPPKNGGKKCAGEKNQVKPCNTKPCVDGAWTPWSVWSDCSVTCGRGTHVRTRACINPPPRNNGSHCSGPERETQDCQTPPCLGLYLKTNDLCPWSPWSPCSQTCGAGSVSRHRACVCEQGGDAACPPEIEAERNSVETQLCYKQPCPGTRTQTWQHCAACTEARHSNRLAAGQTSAHTQVQWSTWSQWSPCSASCGTGQQSSIRFVLEPSQYGGAPCEGPSLRTTTCIAPDCGE
uniref:Complement factor properdin n=1 Tax=Oreochromis aureus TaxID=47969 RepID=A0AAZ1WZT0_OREAU